MTERAQKVWDTYINGYSEALMSPVENFSTYLDKDSRKILASVIRAIVSDYETWEDGTYMVKSKDILEIADELEAL